MTVLVIQNSAADPIGVLGDCLQAQGIGLQTWLPLEHGDLPRGDYDGLIFLGGTTGTALLNLQKPSLGHGRPM